ncbi:MAG: Maf family nucleotide pyrophosphatase [Pseudomonadota bacterium]
MQNSRHLVLASSSQSRQQQLHRLGVEFESLSPNINETPLAGETARALVLRLSEAKARAVAPKFPDSLIIAGDQTAEIDGVFLEKPGNVDAALEQLSGLQGREVEFVSGICVLDASEDRLAIDAVTCTVKFRQLSRAQIAHYVSLDEPIHAAGSFKAESAGIGLFEFMRSSDPSAITGMPLICLVDLLLQHHYEIFQR